MLTALLGGACSSSNVSTGAGSSTTASAASTSISTSTGSPASTTSLTTTTTLAVAPPPSFTGPAPTVRTPGTRFPYREATAQVVPAFVLYVDERGAELRLRPTLGDGASRVVYPSPDGRVLDGVAVRPDGREAFVGVRGGECQAVVMAVDVASGVARQLIADAVAPAVSSDGAWLAYGRVRSSDCERAQLVVRDLASGAEREVGGGSPVAPGSWAWSPDSTLLAFTDCASQCALEVFEVANGTVVTFGSSARYAFLDATGLPAAVTVTVAAPVGWSRDGTPYAAGRCACDRDVGRVMGSWDAQDRPTLNVWGVPEPARTIAFAGDNELVATATAPQTLFRMHGGGPMIDLGVRTNGQAAWPAARPWAEVLPSAADGRPASILTVAHGAVVEIESETGAVIHVVYGPVGGRVGSIALDPRGGRVVAGVWVGECGIQLVSVPLNGVAPSVIGSGAEPAFSPDGTQLAYVANLWARTSTEPLSPKGIGCAHSVVVVRDLRTGAERLVLPARFVPGDPSTGSWESGAGTIRWSPDGTRFAYIVGYEGSCSYEVDVATLAVQMITATPAVDAELRERLGGYPELAVWAWADDGLHLGAYCYGCGVPSIHVRATDARTVDAILTTPQPELDVRDGHALVADNPGDRGPGLVRVDPAGRRVVLRTDTSTGWWR